MAAKSSTTRKPAAKKVAPRGAGKPKAAAAPKKAAAKRSEPRKPAPKTPVSGPAIALAKEARVLPGCGFGIDQSVLLGEFVIDLPEAFDFAAFEPQLEEFAIAAPDKAPAVVGVSREAHLASRIHAWHAAIQRGANVPVFGGCRLWESGDSPAGGRRIGFAVPTYARAATLAAMQFVIDATLALAAAPAGETPADLTKRHATLQQTLARHALAGINAIHFAEAAHTLGIEHALWAEQMWVFGSGHRRLLLNSTVTSATPSIGVAIAKDKLKCSVVLRAAGIPVAQSGWARNADAAAKLAQQVGYPVVVKPANLDQGAGVTAGIEDEEELRRAFADAAKVSQRVMIEKHHFGRDYRVTVLHGKVIKVMDRRPGGVTGDGKRTVAQLVKASNDHDKAMRAKLRKQRPPMMIDEEATKLLTGRGYAADSVIPAGEFVALRRRANISAGGTYDILPPAAIHPDNRMLAVNATVALGLDLAGIDIISGDPAKSWRDTGGIVVEVNAQPQIGFRDTEEIFGQILVELMGGKGSIPIHLAVVPNGVQPPLPLPELAAGAKCNAASWGANAWIAGAGTLGPFANGFRAGRGVLLDPRVTAALIVMSESEVVRFGMPAARFASIRLVGPPAWQPGPMLRQLIAGHSQRIARQQPAGSASAAA